MRKFAFAAMLALAAGFMMAPAVMADSHEDGEKKFSIHGEVRARWEYVENTQDLTDHDENTRFDFDDAFDFWPYRVRIGAMGQFTDNVSGYVELQSIGNFGDTDQTDGGNSWGWGDPLWQSYVGDRDSDEGIQLYQGYINLESIGGSAFGVKIGRQEMTLGNELMIGDLDYYNGQFFDGAHGTFDWESWDLGLIYYNINERNAPGLDQNCIDFGDQNDNFCHDESATFFGAYANFNIYNDWILEPYALYYRDPVEADAFAVPSPFFAGVEGVKTWTVGILFKNDRDEDALLDWSAELAMQTGDVGVNDAMLDHSASVFEGWIGFNLGSERNHRVHVGAFVSSGDENEDDNDAEGFFPLFPDHHAMNRLGNLDFGGQLLLAGFGAAGLGTGITDINVGYTGTFGDHTFMVGYHQLATTEDGPDTFIGLDEDDIGGEFDLMYGYQYTANLAFEVKYSLFQPGDLFELAGAPDELQDDAMRLASQVRLRW